MNMQTPIYINFATVADNSCDYEAELSLYDHDSGKEYDGPMGFDVTEAGRVSDDAVNGGAEYVEYTLALRWIPEGRELLSRDMAALVYGINSILTAEATATERYTEIMNADGVAA